MALAESCTGGLIAKSLTDAPGASKFFMGGIVCYSNEIKKRLLNIDSRCLEKYGAVSEECAREMALSAQSKMNTDYVIATTGIAGPSKDSTKKAVGLVYISFANRKRECLVKEFYYPSDREQIRTMTMQAAFYELYKSIVEKGF